MLCKIVTNVFLCTQCCELKVVHQKQFHHFIFWRILTIHTSFSRELSHNFDFLFKIKIRPLQLGRHCIKSTKPKLASVQSVIVGFQWFACHFDENCFTNLNMFLKSVFDYPGSNSYNFSVRNWIYAQNWAGWMTHRVILWWGDCIFTAFYMTVHQKALYRWPWQIGPRLGGHLGKNLNCIKNRPYLANNRISKHSQEKSRELNMFSNF